MTCAVVVIIIRVIIILPVYGSSEGAVLRVLDGSVGLGASTLSLSPRASSDQPSPVQEQERAGCGFGLQAGGWSSAVHRRDFQREWRVAFEMGVAGFEKCK